MPDIAIKEHCCAVCGVTFYLTANYEDRWRTNGKDFYCPNGHCLAYTETEADKLRRERDAANQRAKDCCRETEAVKRSYRSCKGALTKLRKQKEV